VTTASSPVRDGGYHGGEELTMKTILAGLLAAVMGFGGATALGDGSSATAAGESCMFDTDCLSSGIDCVCMKRNKYEIYGRCVCAMDFGDDD
jgi:hypothetical protein